MNKLIKQAFTLIELLVVIAIIGILSGLIIVGMNGMTDKANIAKSQVFSNSLRNSLLMNLVSELKLDENTGSATADSWGGVNTGTLYGTIHLPVWKTGPDCVSGSCLKFDGTEDYVDFGNRSNLHFSSYFTIEAWVNISSVPTSYDGMILADYNGNYRGYKFGIDLNSKVYAEVGRLSDLSAIDLESTQTLALNKWYHVAASYDGRLNVFLNGSKTTGGVYAPIEAEVSNIIMGKAQWWGRYFQGSIDNVRIYSAAVPTSQIQEQYYAGLNSLLANGRITKEEYLSRVKDLIAQR